MLSAARAGFGSGIHRGNLLPATGSQISVLLWTFNKTHRSAIAGEQSVNLRTTSVRMPGIGIDLFYLDHPLQIEQQPPAFRAGVKKEIRLRLVGLRWRLSIAQH